MRRVLIATPTYSGQVYAAFSYSLGQTLRRSGDAGFDLRDYYPRGKLVHVARNECLAQAIRHGFDDLIWIDADQDWKPEWVTELLRYPVDCVGAPVRKKTDEEERYNVRCDGPESLKAYSPTGLWTAPNLAVGCGFLRMSRKAMQALWDVSDPYRDASGDEARWVFDYRPVDGQLMGEDTAVCERLWEAGIPVWLAPHMNPGHHDGMKRYEGNFMDFVRRWRAEKS